MIALLAGSAVFCLAGAFRVRRVVGALDPYVRPESLPARGSRWQRLPAIHPVVLLGAGLGPIIVPGGIWRAALSGGLIGALMHLMHSRARRRRRSHRLGQELPTVADFLSLYVLAGDTVVGAVRRFCGEASGVAADELGAVLRELDRGQSFPQAAGAAARDSAHPDAGRLYEILAEAHRSGARLVDSLHMFAADRRAAIGRELSTESGRRAVAGYGPILGLMIPTTLVFLMYPTLAGLRALSSTQ